MDELCFGRIRDPGIKRAGKRGIGILAVHAVEDQDVFAGADVIEFKFSVVALKGPEAGLGVVVTIGAIQFDGSEVQGLAVGALHPAANFSSGQGADVVLEAGAVGNFEGRQTALQRFLGELETRGKIGSVFVFAGVNVVKRIDAVGAGAGGEAIVFGAQL